MNARRTVIAAIALAIATTPIQAQKTFISRCTGSAILLKAGGTIVKAEKLYPIGFGDIIATGSGGSARLGANGGFRATLSADTVVVYCHSGPLAQSRELIELVTGTISFSDSGNGRLSPYLVIDGREIKATAEAQTATVSPDGTRGLESRARTIVAELRALEARYELETANLNLVNGRYRDLLASRTDAGTEAPTDADVAAFKAEELFPAEDARSAVIAEISRRETLLCAMRLFVLAPLYMRLKSANPRDSVDVFFPGYEELAPTLGYPSAAIIP